MNRTTVIIIFILIFRNLNAQTKEGDVFLGQVVADSLAFKSLKPLSNYVKNISESTYPIEIRFYTFESFTNDFMLTTLIYNNNKWNLFQQLAKPDESKIEESKVSFKYGTDSLYNYLVQNNIFSLPAQDEIKIEGVTYHVKEKEFTIRRLTVTDGTYSGIEFKIGNLFRNYTFSNSESYYHEFKNISALKNYSNIIQAFSQIQKE